MTGAGDDAPPTPGSDLVPVSPSAAIEPGGRRTYSVVSANRELTFGFLLGYLSLALHSTLDYTRFTGYYVGPWEEVEAIPESEQARAWRRRVFRRTAYTVETTVGEVVAVISDGEREPFATFERLGVPTRPGALAPVTDTGRARRASTSSSSPAPGSPST